MSSVSEQLTHPRYVTVAKLIRYVPVVMAWRKPQFGDEWEYVIDEAFQGHEEWAKADKVAVKLAAARGLEYKPQVINTSYR